MLDVRSVSIVVACLVFAQFTSPDGGRALAWTVQKLKRNAEPANILPETRRPVVPGKGYLPDGLIATFEGSGDIAAAWYGAPTTRYRHALIGDAVEAGALHARLPGGKVTTLTLPKSEVFEDRYPRLSDLDGDGRVEIVTIRSSVGAGAAVTVYGLVDGALRQRASTLFIGLSNRWLNIAGIADFRGSGDRQIAYVQTPHIGGTLFFYAYRAGKLERIGERDGFSNHVIGSPELRLSAVADINGDGRPDLAVPSSSRRHLRFVGFGDSGLNDLGKVALPGRVNRAIRVVGSERSASFIVGLQGGSIVEVARR